MNIRLNEIPSNGLTLRFDLPTFDLDLDSTGVVFSQTIAVDLSVEKLQDLVQIEGEISTSLTLECGRCVSQFQEPMRIEIHAHYLPEKEGEQMEDESLDDSIEVDYYSEGMIDIDKLVRENLILASPFRPLCREDCMGLCNQCGKNLNGGPCGCEVEKPGGPFSRLNDYFSQKS